jgi:hypothetical protein
VDCNFSPIPAAGRKKLHDAGRFGCGPREGGGTFKFVTVELGYRPYNFCTVPRHFGKSSVYRMSVAPTWVMPADADMPELRGAIVQHFVARAVRGQSSAEGRNLPVASKLADLPPTRLSRVVSGSYDMSIADLGSVASLGELWLPPSTTISTAVRVSTLDTKIERWTARSKLDRRGPRTKQHGHEFETGQRPPTTAPDVVTIYREPEYTVAELQAEARAVELFADLFRTYIQAQLPEYADRISLVCRTVGFYEFSAAAVVVEDDSGAPEVDAHAVIDEDWAQSVGVATHPFLISDNDGLILRVLSRNLKGEPTRIVGLRRAMDLGLPCLSMEKATIEYTGGDLSGVRWDDVSELVG